MTCICDRCHKPFEDAMFSFSKKHDAMPSKICAKCRINRATKERRDRALDPTGAAKVRRLR